MTKVMDLDIWGLPASIGMGCDGEYGCEMELEFDYCYVPDAMEEDAINERCCVEALKRLIEKADAEIFDLEDELAIFNGQLNWSKQDKRDIFYEVWTAALREKISSLTRSLQTVRKGSALHASSGIKYQSAQRIHDIITALLKHNFQTGNKKECIISKADKEAQGNDSAASAILGLSRLDKKQIVGTKNQTRIAALEEVKGVHFPETRLTQTCGLNEPKLPNSTCDGREKSTILMPDCEKKVVDSDVTDGSFALQGAIIEKGPSEIVPFQQISEEMGEYVPTLTVDPPQLKVKVEFDEHEPLIMFLNSQGSKRKKFYSTISPKTEILDDEESKKKPFMRSSSSEDGGRKIGTGRQSAKEKFPGHTDENAQEIIENAGNARSQAALSPEIKNTSMSSESTTSQGLTNYSPPEKHTIATVVESECTLNELQNMNKAELMAEAKKHKIKNYHKLKKSLLVNQIACHLGISFADSCTT